MFVPKLEKFLGIEVYATSSWGIGGVIRSAVEDFVVEEVLVDGSKAGIPESESQISHKALGSSTV
ncbi:tRNA pseudouridine(13) synthase TruD, partial [Candidatus Bathyarchaeota archaeon]|nr:tRNA pseudouridine(13) synthase TruD [Candidatus Bathyarchaeota archaeon]